MFAKEVSKFCKSNGEPSITKCKHDLLTFGVGKLEKMNESHLDAMDPYQRSANDISKYTNVQFRDDLFNVEFQKKEEEEKRKRKRMKYINSRIHKSRATK